MGDGLIPVRRQQQSRGPANSNSQCGNALIALFTTEEESIKGSPALCNPELPAKLSEHLPEPHFTPLPPKRPPQPVYRFSLWEREVSSRP